MSPDATEICRQLVAQFDASSQGHLAIIGSIVLNVVMLIRMWLTTRDTNIETRSINRKMTNGQFPPGL